MRHLNGTISAIAIVSAWLAFPRTALADGQAFLRGDANGDGAATASDAFLTLSYLLRRGPAPACLEAADVDLSGTVDVADPLRLLRYHFERGPAPCAPFPTPGADPQGNAHSCTVSQDREALSDPVAKMEIVDAELDATARASILVLVSSSRPIAGFSGAIAVEGGVLAEGRQRPGLLLTGHSPFYDMTTVLDRKLRFGVVVDSGVSDPAAIGPGQDLPVFENVLVCVHKGVEPGRYRMELEEAELIDAATGQAIRPQRVGAFLTVPEAVDPNSMCSDAPPPDQSTPCNPEVLPPDVPPEPPPPGQGAEFIRGDVNTDGQVSIADALMLRRWLFNGYGAPTCLEAADADGDGVLEGVRDIVQLLNHLFPGDPDRAPEIPPPHPEIGPSPGGTELSCARFEVSVPEPTADALRLGTVEGAPGDEVLIPVYLSNAIEVEAFQLVLRFDPAVFQPLASPREMDLQERVLALDGAVYGPSFDVARRPPWTAQRLLAPGILAFGFIPSLIEEGAEAPAGGERLVFALPGRIAAEAEPGAAVSLELFDGADGRGLGPDRLRNELIHRGTSRYLSTRPRLGHGLLKINIDVVIFVRGDANADGAVGLDDALAILRHLFVERREFRCPDAADANDDGDVDIADAVAVLIAKFIDARAIPRPYPASGRDLSPDALPRCRS